VTNSQQEFGSGRSTARTLLRRPHRTFVSSIMLTVLGSCALVIPLLVMDSATATNQTQSLATAPTSAKAAGRIEVPPPPTREGSPVVADPAGFLYFDRVDVESIGADGTRRMTVASHGLARPPKGQLLAPLEVLSPSSSFGFRFSPLTGAPGEFHWGQDFAAPCGTRVYSADRGVARAVGWHPWGGGNRVEIDHGNGIITTYNHLESTAVRQGASVKVGEVIAFVGTTGSSTGCHLHFETIENGVHADPLHWTLIPVSQLDRLDEIPRFRFDPGSGTEADRAPVWAVPRKNDVNRGVTGGANEGPALQPPETGGKATRTAEPTSTASPSSGSATTSATSGSSSSATTSPTSGSSSSATTSPTSGSSPAPVATSSSAPAPVATSSPPQPQSPSTTAGPQAPAITSADPKERR
jgi:murein DD-endopeptidase MepM/ murein hydrolase activator NlpD